MPQFFKKNIALLAAAHPPAALTALKDQLPPKIHAQTTPGGVTITYDTHLLHSAYDPEKEGRAFAKNLRGGDRVFLYGFGLGYHVHAILDQIGEQGALIAVEMNLDILSAALILRDQSAIFSRKNFSLVFSEQEGEAAAAISAHMAANNEPASRLEVLIHAPSFKCIPPHFTRIANALEVLLLERRTPAIFGGIEAQNYALNKVCVTQSPGIRTLHGRHRGQPAVLASAGPSLEDFLPYLARFREHCLLTCVDTALPVFMQAGFCPDYVFSLDPQDESFGYFTEHLDAPSRLIFTPTANAKIVAHCARWEKFVVVKEGHSLLKNDDALSREKGSTRAGGSVSCLGLDSLIQLGCNPVFLAGQDCAFPGKRTYTRHSLADEHFNLHTDGNHTVATTHLEKARQKKRVSVATYSGDEIPTDQALYSYLRNLEQIAAAHPETGIYNLFPHGARIEHIQPIYSASEALRLTSQRRSASRNP